MIVLIGIAVAVLYLGVCYAVPGPRKTVGETVPVSRDVNVFRNFAFGVLGFFLCDAAIFHSDVYITILQPRSHAGSVASSMRAEKRRNRAADKEILVIGDSRVALGFDSATANQIGSAKNVAFIERAMPGTEPELWHYFLREIDPARNRYRMIVLPLKADDLNISRSRGGGDRPSDIVQMAPLLRYSDALSFASSFRQWPNRARAFTACILRGTAYQSDLFDLLEHPAARIAHVRRGADVATGWHPENRDRDLAGLVVNPATGRLEGFPQHLNELERRRIERDFKRLRRGMSSPGYDYAWSKQIVNRYAPSQTRIVFLQLPRSPLVSLLPAKPSLPQTPDEAWLSSHAVVLDYRTFESLETPEYFLDSLHLNEKGQRMFTQRLTEELLARLQLTSAETSRSDPAGSRSE